MFAGFLEVCVFVWFSRVVLCFLESVLVLLKLVKTSLTHEKTESLTTRAPFL